MSTEDQTIDTEVINTETEQDETAPEVVETPPEDETPEVVARIEGDTEEEEDQDNPNDREWVRNLRKQQRELKRENRELKQKLSTPAGDPSLPPLGEKPTLQSCGYDDEKLDRELDAWYANKNKHETAKKTAEEREKAEREAWQSRLSTYESLKSELPQDAYEESEALVQEHMSVTQQSIIIKGARNPAELVFALGQNPSTLKRLAAIKDPVEFAFAAGEIMSKAKIERTAKTIPAPDRVVKSGGKTPAMTSTRLDDLRAKAEKSGDFTEYFAAKLAAK